MTVTSFTTIVLTTDFSEVSRRALPPARTLAEKFGSHLILVHVLEERMPPFLEELLPDSEEILGRQRERAVETLDRIAREELGDGLNWETIVVVGIPHQEIVEIARQNRADLIVMATHGRGPLGHALIGSTTERVLHRAPCPVMAVRVADPDS
jgi:nucleotide-binding universal stress UspA family protein